MNTTQQRAECLRESIASLEGAFDHARMNERRRARFCAVRAMRRAISAGTAGAPRMLVQPLVDESLRLIGIVA